ncbi:hypothetical protein C7B65_04325 [Phormidesmis priestleyi ULC007]|uniref:SPOR domain-containing protein n=1 Tax=Phormidesmis priestleyi ULC007 TaxID=1920490 RepID=A0A2T1DKZ5_9CYAN|nr:hypothetical protein [Phormidesmis priestleyi]PSB21170.1 hypothetical protein C7B65_04325 [Phormidesmis priestleyi ULC007]PZO51305.1 MAG: hypothetical protein DCF14_09385 [Phormidesmis priestleyi]
MTCVSPSVSRQNRWKRIQRSVSFIVLGGCLSGLIAPIAAAQSPGFPLPPAPPATPVPPQTLPTLPVEGTPLPSDRVFQAPINQQPVPIAAPSNRPQYRVFVNGDSALLLQQVRRVEPQAFIQQYGGRQVIQAGVFSTEANARQQTEALAAQGIASEISTSNMGSLPGGNSARGYYVVVPEGRSDLNDLRDRTIRLGVQQNSIQLRDRPLGPHLAVGPFAQRQQAETMERYLRDKGNLDARIVFDR